MIAAASPQLTNSPEQTIGDAVRAMTRKFTDAGLATPDVDARFLAQGILGLDATAMMRDAAVTLGVHAAPLEAAMLRRLAHEPVARILGWREFYGRRFEITQDVLDPRPETETVVDLTLALADREGWRERPLRFADIGTGSGILAVTLLTELPQAKAVATDISPAALAVAKRNAAHAGVDGRVSFAHTSALRGITGHLDLVVSNPPYIPTGDIAGLEADVRLHDPRDALDGGDDGLDVFRQILRDFKELKARLWFVAEFGIGQGLAIESLFGSVLASPPRLAEDLGGHTRAVALEIHC